MVVELLSAKEASRRLGISVGSFYDWLGQSDRGIFVIRGQPLTIDYLQGGPRGQGRIKITADEVERIKERMRVRPQRSLERSHPSSSDRFPGIIVKLGRPGRQRNE